MDIKKKIFAIVSLLTALCLTASSELYAISEFSVGLNAGATRDPNNLESNINRINSQMEALSEVDPDSKVTQIDVPYAFVWGINLKYQFNYILFRMGAHLAKPGAGVKGSFTDSAGEKTTLRIQSYQNSFPLTIAFVLPLKARTSFYMGLGPTYHQAYLKIIQSNSIMYSRSRYTGDFVGYHFMFGAEVPLTERFTFTTEWIHQESRSYPMDNGGEDTAGNPVYTPRQQISAKGDFVLFGVNYYIQM